MTRLTVAVQMDPIERIKIAGDSTFALLLGAAIRRWLPRHLMVYILGRGFLATVVAGFGAGRLKLPSVIVRDGPWKLASRKTVTLMFMASRFDSGTAARWVLAARTFGATPSLMGRASSGTATLCQGANTGLAGDATPPALAS